MPEEERPGASDFDLPRAIVALASELFDPMPCGMKTPESERGKLRRVVDAVEWYTWPIHAEKLHVQTGITPPLPFGPRQEHRAEARAAPAIPPRARQ